MSITKSTQELLIDVLYSALNETAPSQTVKEKFTADALPELYKLSKEHDVAHIVSSFVYNNEIEAEPELLSKLQKQEFISVFRCEQMNFAFEQICKALDEASIPYIPLKGSVIRPFYPSENMRTSCDIDVLIHETDLESAISELEKKGFQCGERNYHDVSLYSENKIHLELHFNILENIDNLDSILKDAWNYAVPGEKSRYNFTKEFFAFHIFAHMSYHFLSGGCGIRSLMDVWIMNHKMGITYSYAEELLKKAGIYKFAVEMSNLAESCFTENERNDFYDSVLDYIFNGGMYGNTENNIAVTKSKNSNMFVYALKRLFPTYKTMVIIYPILKKAPYLLPFCWLARWFKLLFGKKVQKAMSEMTVIKNADSEKVNDVKNIRSRLGL